MTDWQIVTVPFSSEPGHDMWRGPDRIVDSLGITPWRRLDIDRQDLDVSSWETLCQTFQQRLADGLNPTRPWLFVAGECTVAPIPVGALQRHHSVIQVIWIDAHGDIHTPETSTSGFLGGMPLNVLIGGSLPIIAKAAHLHPVPIERLTMVGTRDLDPPEARLIEQLGIATVNDPDAISQRVRSIGLPAYVHVDVDVLDLQENPAQSYPSPGGFSLQQLTAILTGLLKMPLVAAVTVCAYSPGLDVNERGLQSVQAIMRTIVS
jgi:arginase